MCSLVPLRKAAYVWYRTMTAILLRRERGRNNAEMYAVLVVTPPPLFSAKLRFKRGGVTTREYGNGKIPYDLIRTRTDGSHKYTQIRCMHEFHDLR